MRWVPKSDLDKKGIMARTVMSMQARTHDREEKERRELKKNTLRAMLKGQGEAQSSERKQKKMVEAISYINKELRRISLRNRSRTKEIF